jgi:hypothetical protein
MAGPLFIETSQGYVNLNLVTHISSFGRTTRINFNSSNGTGSVEIPIEEGDRLIEQLRRTDYMVDFTMVDRAAE